MTSEQLTSWNKIYNKNSSTWMILGINFTWLVLVPYLEWLLFGDLKNLFWVDLSLVNREILCLIFSHLIFFLLLLIYGNYKPKRLNLIIRKYVSHLMFIFFSNLKCISIEDLSKWRKTTFRKLDTTTRGTLYLSLCINVETSCMHQ